MPQVFKTLATIIAWILFVFGCLGLISRSIVWLTVEGFTGTGPEMGRLALQFVYCAIYLVAAVLVMVLRKKMD